MSTIEAHILLSNLEQRGVTLSATPKGTIRCLPKSALVQEDIDRLKRNKAALLEIIPVETESIQPSQPSEPSHAGSNPHIYDDLIGDGCRDGCPEPSLDPIEQRELARASELGLVARWSYNFGYISIHDPTAGQWHDIPTKDAPDWAKQEAFTRRDIRKRGGNPNISASELEEIWEQVRLEKQFSEASDAVTDAGIVYEDYLGEEE